MINWQQFWWKLKVFLCLTPSWACPKCGNKLSVAEGGRYCKNSDCDYIDLMTNI